MPPVVPAAAVKMPRVLRPFGSATDAERLQLSIDAEWQRDLEHNAAEIAAFPEIPSEDRIRYSLQRWREQMSSPAVNLAVCAVCAMRCPAAVVSHVITRELKRLRKLEAITIAQFKRDHLDGIVFAPPIQCRHLAGDRFSVWTFQRR